MSKQEVIDLLDAYWRGEDTFDPVYLSGVVEQILVQDWKAAAVLIELRTWMRSAEPSMSVGLLQRIRFALEYA